jgi:hypothetical protein
VSEQRIHLGVLIASVALTVSIFASHWGDPKRAASVVAAHGPESPLAVIPPGSAFLLQADVARIAHSPLGGYLARRLARVHGASDLTDLCGFEPLTRLTELALAVPSAGSPAPERAADFGIVARGRFSGDEITRCGSAVIAARGGKATTSSIGSFGSVRDGGGSDGEIAAKDGLLIVSGGSYFRKLLDSADGAENEPDGPRDAQHAALRRALGSGDIVATWLLPDDWFERVAGEANARLSPLRALKSLGARVVVSSDVKVSLLLQCSDPESAAQIATLFRNMRTSLGSLALAPSLSEAAKRVEIAPVGAQLRLSLALTEAELTPLFDLLLVP